MEFGVPAQHDAKRGTVRVWIWCHLWFTCATVGQAMPHSDARQLSEVLGVGCDNLILRPPHYSARYWTLEGQVQYTDVCFPQVHVISTTCILIYGGAPFVVICCKFVDVPGERNVQTSSALGPQIPLVASSLSPSVSRAVTVQCSNII